MNKFFRKHRSHGSKQVIDHRSSHAFPEPLDAPKKSIGSELVPERPGPPASNAVSADSSSVHLVTRASFSTRSPSRSKGNRSLGLHLVSQPLEASCLDIVFIHGLGGDSRKSWSKDHNTDLFWPGLWLPNEPELEKARIFTFGYNANFWPGETKNVTNISDFAKELLFELRFSKSQDGQNYAIGQMPLIFVAHSMGGLLAKKAYLLGQNDENYKDIVRSIMAIVFLSTPHRGSNLAKMLNKILTASFQSPRNYITDLNKSSYALEEINEQFRHIASRLSIWSFYETLPTQVGPRKMMILEKDSAILGYSQEISRPLHADHHGVCKFSSREDANYVIIRNALESMAMEVARKANASVQHGISEFNALQGMLTGFVDSEEDLNKHNRLRIEGTCEWIFNEDGLEDWLDVPEGFHLFWFGAAPASGKSVLSAYLVTTLQQRNLTPQYFFFNYGDQQKRSFANLLRSIACQVATTNLPFRRSLLDLSKQGLRLDKADALLLWHRVYVNTLFKMDLQQPLYWVVDALDESDTPQLFLELVRTCSISGIPLRIFLTSRRTDTIQMGINKAAKVVKLTQFEKQSFGHNAQDIQRLVEQEVSHMRGSDQFKARVVQRITTRAESNFLWTRLVLDEIIYCHTETAVEETLDELPSDMYKLYERMENVILDLPRKSDRLLAKSLLQWTIGARRPMSLDELSQALEPKIGEILDLRGTILDVCGQFLRIDASDRVVVIHHSAREYLTQLRNSELFIDTKTNHQHLCVKALTALLEARFASTLIDNPSSQPFLLYVATSWSYHLIASGSASSAVLDILLNFFKSRAFPLWVCILSSTKRLDILIATSKSLSSFTALVKRQSLHTNSVLLRLRDLQLLDQWAIDLIKIVGKFSTSLLKYPQAIYGLISPFSPLTSALYQQPFCKNDRVISVPSGLDVAWTDRLVRFSLPDGCEADKIACGGKYIGVLSAGGRVFLWDDQSFVNIHIVEHGEPVVSITFSAQGDRLVTYGLKSTKLWEIPSGEALCVLGSVEEAKAIVLCFSNDNSKVLAGFDDRAVRYFRVEDANPVWQLVHPDLFKEPLGVEAAANSPTCVAFSKDGLYAGVAYRGFPLSVWSLEFGQCINRCNRGQGTGFAADQYSAGWYVTWRFVWNPITNHIIGFYTDGFVFKWHPLTGEYQEARAFANDVVASADGKLFLSSTTDGTITIWDFACFTVIYQLSSEDLLMGMAFSPSSLRFYDLRCGMVNSVNVWEPNSLLRFSDTDENTSDIVSEVAISISVVQAPEASVRQLETVTALATCSNGKFFCTGNDDGLLQLHSINHDFELIEIGKFNSFMNVDHIVWSQDSRHIVAADLGGNVMIRQIEVPDPARLSKTVKIMPITSPKLNLEEQAIHELLFSQDSSLLLVITNQSGYVWSIRNNKLLTSEKLAHGRMRKWFNHPTRADLLLCVGSHDIRAYSWQTLHECSKPVPYHHTGLEQQDMLSVNRSDDLVDGVVTMLRRTDIIATDDASQKLEAMITQDQRYILVQMSPCESFTGVDQFFFCPILELEHVQTGTQYAAAAAIKTISIPDEVKACVRITLGMLTGNRFVFLDKDLWVCTYRVDAFSLKPEPQNNKPKRTRLQSDDKNHVFQRHYFIPDDWATGSSLDLCCMTEIGTLIYPRDDKVSVIKADMSVPAFRRGSSAF